MAKYRVPSQAANGSQTFSDNLVGRQITDGSSQLTNTNFDLYRVKSEKDDKDFKTSSFSNFITLDDIGLMAETDNTIKFNGDKNDASKSLFGSLKQRINVSITKIINNYPSAIYADKTVINKTEPYTAFNIVYNNILKTTDFDVEQSTFYNPFDILFTQPNSNTQPEFINENRNIFSQYQNYVLEYNKVKYNILNYSNEDNIITFKVSGNPFSGVTEINENYLIKPNDGICEEFFDKLDDLESSLMNRETNPKFEVTFKVVRESISENGKDLVDYKLNWPIAKDGWNIQIVGIDFSLFLSKLNDISDEIDDYKSNLIIRFLTAPQLYEFDTEDKYAESIFQLYGQNFDRVKKFIDNIAYMRNVTYDSINNLPNKLLKNLSNNLGFNSVNLFDEKSLNDILYTRQDSAYEGITVGKNLVESEYEFYRRLITNLIHIYKSKGTRKSLEFFLKFIGAPEPMIKINEYVYKVKSLPNISTFEDNIYDIIEGTNTDETITGYTFNSTQYLYLTGLTTNITTLIRSEYPINSDGFPQKIESEANNIFFQKGSGWYNDTLEHRSPLVIDYENSILTGRSKTTKTKNKPHTFGEDYFDLYRNFSGLNYGFDLMSEVDNLKINSINDENNSKLTLNRKNINVFLSSTQAIEYDIYRQSRNLEVSFGRLEPQSNVSFAEFIDNALNKILTNSNTVKYNKTYIDLVNVYNEYVNNVTVPYDFITVNEFINKISPYWVNIVEQFIPASTLWLGGNVIENSKFKRSKYQYKKSCPIFEMVDDRYPNFEEYVNNNPTHTSFRFYPIFNIDNMVYSGSTYVTTGTTVINYTNLNQQWDTSLVSLINDINTYNGYERDNIGDDNNYGNEINYSGITGSTITSPLISLNYFVNEEGIDKIKFKSFKYGNHSCTVTKNFNFQVLMESNI
jgi:hypothetical protein